MAYVDYQTTIVEKYLMQIVGWPAGVPFVKPSEISSITQLQKLVNAFKTGTAH
ncbi:hypothetical protein FIBSPDRAFT_756069 [Athelia psychrophila]|uniref:Uncharacterized protein n=1 Tax=Athelia psychrophila TaxID=1759441 RepID=A0A166APY2_9AGAM|nr:hypothetical protein FIBSPDRAFT_756069 [Fibularhizoctonia sp. CBS 109695]